MSNPIDQTDPEAVIDKFATLFSPATPRATPTNSRGHSPAPQRQQTQPLSPASDDFGSFVSVSPSEDPLSAFYFTSPTLPPAPYNELGQTSMSLSSHTANGDLLHFTTPLSSDNKPKRLSQIVGEGKSSSLNFFDKFAEDAKRASEKRNYLDEVLMHEDDPLYWLKDAGSSLSSTLEPPSNPEPLQVHPDQPLVDLNFDDEIKSAMDDVVHSGPSAPTPQMTAPSSRQSRPQVRERSRTPTHSRQSSLSRQSSQPRSQSATRATPPSTGSPKPTPKPSGYATLSISSRFISSLLSNSRPSEPEASPTAAKTFDTLFSDPSEGPHGHHLKPEHTLPAYLSSSPSQSTSVPAPQRGYTSVPPPTISHFTPFANPSATPFIPPTGAPGFMGSSKSWDRGYSDTFDKEATKVEKVELLGRREMTTPVLDSDLATQIRPHLPALARLPIKWHLIYSLDQHGISLNTLYHRCEAPSVASPVPGMTGVGKIGNAGMLVVVKDSQDALFGAWMGDGVRLNKGGYYGSGESFLWKFVRDELKVFKWTGRNDYVALCEMDYISFGGGDGTYGLYLDDTLLDGSSARCPTFNNEPLCGGTADGSGTGVGGVAFECVGLEVWGVGG